ncbi:MAG: FapA family protein, partial [Desulfobacterales bacterium]|nr:FapA family protein [Desulfobacterales bacterium]
MLEKIALQKNLISKDECRRAQAACRDAPRYEKALIAYFRDKSLITDGDLKALVATLQILRMIRRNTRFGEIAVEKGYLDREKLEKILQLQKTSASGHKSPQFIGDLLQADGSLTPAQLEEVSKTMASGEEKKAEPVAVSPQSPPVPAKGFANSQEISGGMILEVDREGMNAYLRKSESFSPDISPLEIMDILADYKIVHGLVKEALIQGFIRSSALGKKGFKVARGRKPVAGRHARVEYFFETDHLKVGNKDEEGNMDFRSRGTVPWVEKGVLLARKIPMVLPEAGQNIFGDAIEPSPVKDIPFDCGTGTRFGGDGLEIHGETPGFPYLDWSGQVSVTPVFKVSGDVDYQTGHLDFVGDIMVLGGLKAGFRVEG